MELDLHAYVDEYQDFILNTGIISQIQSIQIFRAKYSVSILNMINAIFFFILKDFRIPTTAMADLSDDDEWELEEEQQQHGQTQWMALAGLQPDSNIFEGFELGQRPGDNLCNWDEIRENYPDWQNMTSFIHNQKQNEETRQEISDIPQYEFSPEQKKAFDLVINHYHALVQSDGKCEQLCLIVQGVAGNYQ